ncbi:beta-ketoacyl-ACP synthase II [Pseudothermotoga thermarum]|uniref:3-oxoacyl-[acyl-carrier-protein] synthase 2 n=1 Tax=Pseudothermotoga thermarum DSM 5069 TaxID=688269 RepID=F7YY79_9THEM|nr:beta-ketoacyl-ACP synthase II [Pseudothermotoga thermarum]AEH50900.1 3-oxoacyl-(acyl-carrier-protein) synthase II [Pseudothermotoga thermarum DSM 5069]
MRRVVVTGMGIVCPIGVGKRAVLEALKNLEIGVDFITSFDASNLPVRIAAEVKGLNPEEFIDKKLVRRTDRFVHFALIAAKEALEESAIDVAKYSERTAVLIASGMGGFITLDTENNKFLQYGASKVSPFLIPMLLINMASGILSIEYGIKGVNFAPVSACAASGHAIALGAMLIRHGYADVAIVGGSEATIAPLPIAGFASMKALSTRNEDPKKASRPFDVDRDGFVMGEGAGVLVLEAEEVAKQRGAKIIAEVKGFAMNGDAYHMSAPDPNGEGAEKAMRMALEDAGLTPEDIQYVSCHATSTPAGDVVEAKAIERVFGDKVLVNSTKALMGHLLGAAAAAETVAGILQMLNNFVHGMPNLDNKDPEVNVNVVGKQNVECKIENFLKNSFGFGGHNVSLVIGRYKS